MEYKSKEDEGKRVSKRLPAYGFMYHLFFLRVCGLAAHCLIPQVAHFWNPLYSGVYDRLLYGSYWHQRSTMDAAGQNRYVLN